MLQRVVKLATLLTITITILPLAAAAPVDANVFGDSNADVVAVSVFGNATCSPVITVEIGMCVAVSGTGASSCASSSEYDCGLAVSGTGDTRSWGGATATGGSTGYYVVAGSNECRLPGEAAYENCVDASLTQPANGHDLAVSGTSDANGYFAISGSGNAAARYVSASGTGSSASFLAVSLLGDSSGPGPTTYDDNLASVSGTGSSSGNVLSLSLLGASTANQVAVSVFGPASAPCAISVLGERSGDCIGYAEGIACNLSGGCLP